MISLITAVLNLRALKSNSTDELMIKRGVVWFSNELTPYHGSNYFPPPDLIEQ